MSRLAQQQQALLAVLFDWPNESAIQNIASYADADWARGLKVYQANGHALACSALRAAYPVVAQLLGDESFDALAKALWHAQPPRCGDAALWVEGLADFVRASTQLASEPYLSDVAALEWALHRAAGAPDGLVDAASFALLGEHDPDQVQLVLSPGCATLRSAWPVVSLLKAHDAPASTPGSAEVLPQIGAMLRAGVAEEALVWRQGLRAQLRLAWAGEVVFVSALQSGRSLGQALQQAPALEIADWLPMAVQTGLLLGVRFIDKKGL